MRGCTNLACRRSETSALCPSRYLAQTFIALLASRTARVISDSSGWAFKRARRLNSSQRPAGSRSLANQSAQRGECCTKHLTPRPSGLVLFMWFWPILLGTDRKSQTYKLRLPCLNYQRPNSTKGDHVRTANLNRSPVSIGRPIGRSEDIVHSLYNSGYDGMTLGSAPWTKFSFGDVFSV